MGTTHEAFLDPEVSALVAHTRLLVSRAHELSSGIHDTIDELHEFAAELRGGGVMDRRRADLPFDGPDRRRGEDRRRAH